MNQPACCSTSKSFRARVAKQSCRCLSLYAVATRASQGLLPSKRWHHGLLLWLLASRSHMQHDQQMLVDILSHHFLAVSLEHHKCTGLQGSVKLRLLCHLICILLAATLKPLCLDQAEGFSSPQCVWKLASEEWERRQQAGTGLLTSSAATKTQMRRLPAMPVTTARCSNFAAAAQKHPLPSVHITTHGLTNAFA